MAEPRGRSEPWDGLRRATVRLVDPANPSVWGTGFFITHDVLLTCWHVVRDVAEQRVLVEQPLAGHGSGSSLAWQSLGEATLLEAGQEWDLALLSFRSSDTYTSSGQAKQPVKLPLVEWDPPPDALLLSSGFPEDAASRHDASYAAVGRTTPPGQSVEFLRLKADGVVPGISGAALVEAATGRVCGVIARNELVGGASDGGLAVPLAVFRAAFPEYGEAMLNRNRLECQEWGAAAQQRLGRANWIWPQALPQAEVIGRFVGRRWLFDQVRAWACDGDERALLITADFGVGKSAFLAKLVEQTIASPRSGTHSAGVPIAAHHVCDHSVNDTLAAGEFVCNIATQLARVLPAYRTAIEADDAEQLRSLLNLAPTNKDPGSAWARVVVTPLRQIPPPPERMLLVVDALDEALEHRSDGEGTAITIVDLLADQMQRLPEWMRVLAASRPHEKVLSSMGFAFSTRHIEAEQSVNLDDIEAYGLDRCQQPGLTEQLKAAGLSAEVVAKQLRALSGGKFLYVERVLNEIIRGRQRLAGANDLAQFPEGMNAFYASTFKRRFCNKDSYSKVAYLLALLCEQHEPIGLHTLAAISGLSVDMVETTLEPLEDLLVRHWQPGEETGDWTFRLDHFSLQQWLTERNQRGRWRAGSFHVDRSAAADAITQWARSETEANRAHLWPYLVRHLFDHLPATERPKQRAFLLGQFAWLKARVQLVGVNALLEDVAAAKEAHPSQWLDQLEKALRQGAHIISRGNSWPGHQQLASQLLARLSVFTSDPKTTTLLDQAKESIYHADGVFPLVSSLAAPEALLRSMSHPVIAMAVLPDGRLVSGSSDSTIRIWDPEIGSCSAILRGHKGWVRSVALLHDGRLASGSSDRTIRIWDMTCGKCVAVLEGHERMVHAIAPLSDGRLASRSKDETIRIWDMVSGVCTKVYGGYGRELEPLVALPDGRLALAHSSASEITIKVLDPNSGKCSAMLTGHEAWVSSLAVIGEGILASGSYDGSIRIWDIMHEECSAVLFNHNDWEDRLRLYRGHLASYSSDALMRVFDPSEGTCYPVNDYRNGIHSIVVLPNSRLASYSENGIIRIWNIANGSCSILMKRKEGLHASLAPLPSGNLASGSSSGIRIWQTSGNSCSDFLNEHEDSINALVALSDGRLASGSSDGTIRIWNPATAACLTVLKGQGLLGSVNTLVALPNRLLASGSGDGKIRIWNPDNGRCTTVFQLNSEVLSLVLLTDGLLACGSAFENVLIWDLTSKACTKSFNANPWAELSALPDKLFLLPDGRLAFHSKRGEKRLKILDVSSGSITAGFEHGEEVAASGQLADGYIITVSESGKIRIWDAEGSSSPDAYEYAADSCGSVTNVVIWPDRRLFFAANDKTIRLWDPARADAAPKVIFVADDTITALMVYPRFSMLVAGDNSGQLHWLHIPDRR